MIPAGCGPKLCQGFSLGHLDEFVHIPGFIDKPGLLPSPEGKKGSLAN